jgi:hypothetical protein
MPFHKSRTAKAEWLQDILLDHSILGTYKRIKFYPKRGDACLNKYGRTCQWFGQCDMSIDSLFPNREEVNLEGVDKVEAVDFKFTLSQLVEAQQSR